MQHVAQRGSVAKDLCAMQDIMDVPDHGNIRGACDFHPVVPDPKAELKIKVIQTLNRIVPERPE